MAITLPVPGGGGATTPSVYYGGTNLGEYQFISLSEIIDNFIAAYVGEGKILQNVLKGDVNFHAHRALQELHYDTLKSCKSQEIEVCPSLCMPLPHDYVNYTKITTVDANGIEHIIYPTRHTSNPFAIEQEDCEYVFEDGGGISEEETCTDGAEQTCDGSNIQAFKPVGNETYPFILVVDNLSYNVDNARNHWYMYFHKINTYCDCLNNMVASPDIITCGTFGNSQNGDWLAINAALNTCENLSNQNYPTMDQAHLACWADPSCLQNCAGDICHYGWGNPGNTNMHEWCTYGTWTTQTGTTSPTCTTNSGTFDSWTSSGGNSVAVDSSTTTNLAVDGDNYFQNTGQRYGIQPEHAQVNGSFFIDCLRGKICFSSNLSGKRIILHYLSDGHGTADEAIVPKLAEEAMYKWIAYGCLSARADVPEYLVQRYKKEKFAETRKAKIRISNIKIEEISQIMRNKSKWIKH